MKVNEYYVNPKKGEKILDILKIGLKPDIQPYLTLTKYRDPDKAAYKISYSTYVSKEEYKRIKAIATNPPDAENKEAPSDESNTENNKEDENEMAEILRKFCEFQTLKEIRIPPDDVPVEDGVKRIVIKLKD